MPDWKGGAMSAQPPLAAIDERFERSTTSFSISEAGVPKPPVLIPPAAVYRDGRTENVLVTATGAKPENAVAPPTVAGLTEAKPSAKVQAGHLAFGTAVPGVVQAPTRSDTIGIELAKVKGSSGVGPAHLAPIEERSASLTADANLASMVPPALNQRTQKHRASESTGRGPGIVAEHQITQTATNSFSVTPLTKKGPDKEKERRASETVAYNAVFTQKIEQLGPESSDIDVGLLPEECQEKLPATAPESEVESLEFDVEQDQQKTQKKELGKITRVLEPTGKLPSLEYEAMAQPEDQQKTRHTGLGRTSQDPEQAEELTALEYEDLESKEGHEGVLKESETPLKLERLALSKQPKEEQEMQREEIGEIVQDEKQSEKPQQLKQPGLAKKQGSVQDRKYQLEQLALSKQPKMQQAMLREEFQELLRDQEQSGKPQQLKQRNLTKKEGGGQIRKDAVKAVETPLQLEKLALSKQPREEQVMQRIELGEIVQDEKQSEKASTVETARATKEGK
ncbi:hypothetical protein MTO96_009272 [Rhipicephalus appendiculatus]